MARCGPVPWPGCPRPSSSSPSVVSAHRAAPLPPLPFPLPIGGSPFPLPVPPVVGMAAVEGDARSALFPIVGNRAEAVLGMLGIDPAASSDAVAAVHEGHLRWILSHLGVPGPAFHLFLGKVATCRAAAAGHAASVIGGPGVGPRSVAPWSHFAPRPPPNHGWIEMVAVRAPVSGAALARAIREVFMESAVIAEFNEAVRHSPGAVLFTFQERVAASGCGHCTPVVPLDQSVDVSRQRRWSEGPRKRIALAACELRRGPPAGADERAVRPPAALLAEAGCRTQLASIAGSWRSYASGILAWSAFMDACFPAARHFPATSEHVLAFVPFFANGRTCEKYLQHVKFAENLLGLVSPVDQGWLRSVRRGAVKFHQRADPPRCLQADVSRLVVAALRQDRLSFARMFAVCRTFMGRAAAELHPLQVDGRAGLEGDDTRWHSQVALRVGDKGLHQAIITLRTRKNAPGGAKLIRWCSCSESVEDKMLCGVCALRAQVREHRAAGKGPRELLFPEVSGPGGAGVFKKLATAANVAPAWHAFRRGAASDMLRKGAPLSAILAGGGWRSAAFLKYLAQAEVDERVALEQAFALSDSEA